MKKGLFLFRSALLTMTVALMIAVVPCQAQVVRTDSRTGELFAYIDSVQHGGLYGCWLTRMVLKKQVDFTPTAVGFSFYVQYAYVVDSNTTNYYTSDISAYCTVALNNPLLALGTAYLGLWQYAADSAKVNGLFGVNVNFDNARLK